MSGSGGSGVGTRPACAAVTQKGELLGVDMYLLIDKSDSMLETTATGATKWDAIKGALEAFVKEPRSAGLGVGLQYFPQFKAGVPATCTTNESCGPGGPCFLKTCDNGTTVSPCSKDSECGFGGSCVEFGVCERYPSGGAPIACSPLGSSCANPLYGSCIDLPGRWCVNGIDCTTETYAKPDVAIGTLPDAQAALIASIERTVPEGRTPTGPALSGAVSEARTWAQSHPGRQVVAVLATDGLPTECTPLDIGPVSQIAATGFAGNPSIPTYVIGVFAPEDTESPQNLQTIAKAGGTKAAFIVDTSQDVTAQFLAALDAIRAGTALPCELKIPEGDGKPLDYDQVNLVLSPASGGSTQLVNVGDQSRCATAPGIGWYYDVDPKVALPNKIDVCPDVCSAFQKSVGSTVDLQIGCDTIVR
jgi:hypothetical protein